MANAVGGLGLHWKRILDSYCQEFVFITNDSVFLPILAN